MADQSYRFHAIYQDAFSPKKNPTLWTKEWFSFLRSISTEDVILSTYSASTSIRKSLHEAGWKIQQGEKFGRKRTSTRATLNGETSAEILLQLERSSVDALTDLRIDANTGKIIS
jgi:tRNA U34 5-methylaminomethyl-2-thiouridine-forming methyltransferase MnmC